MYNCVIFRLIINMTICHTGTLDTRCAKGQQTIFTFLYTDLVTVLNLFKHDLARGSLNMKWPHTYAQSRTPITVHHITTWICGIICTAAPPHPLCIFSSFGFNKIIITAVAHTQSCRKVGGGWFYERRGFTDGRHLWNICGRC